MEYYKPKKFNEADYTPDRASFYAELQPEFSGVEFLPGTIKYGPAEMWAPTGLIFGPSWDYKEVGEYMYHRRSSYRIKTIEERNRQTIVMLEPPKNAKLVYPLQESMKYDQQDVDIIYHLFVVNI